MGYRQTLDRFGLQSLTTTVQIPDYRLMIDTAEDLAPIPLLIFEDLYSKYVVEQMQKNAKMTPEEINKAIQNNEMEINDFYGNSMFIGNPLGEV